MEYSKIRELEAGELVVYEGEKFDFREPIDRVFVFLNACPEDATCVLLHPLSDLIRSECIERSSLRVPWYHAYARYVKLFTGIV